MTERDDDARPLDADSFWPSDSEQETALPDVGEITFEPARDEPHEAVEARVAADQTVAADLTTSEDAAAGEAAPPEQAPERFTPRILSKRRAATLAAFAQGLLPQGSAVPESAADVGVAERLDAALANWEREPRRSFERMLTLFEWSSVLSRSMRRFSRLNPEARRAYLARADRSKLLLRRSASDLIRFFCLNQWAATPVIESRLGFTYECEKSDPPREGESLEILGYPQVQGNHTEECDVVVIGSGAGGAVVAKECAELGLSVVVVEEGADHTRSDFTGSPFDRFQKLYRQHGFTAALGRPVVALPLGKGVGGTTVINSGTCYRTPDRVLARWAREFAIPELDSDAMRPYFERVERIQHVQPVPEEVLGENARIFRRGVDALGLKGAPLDRNIDGCRGCGVCPFGCPSDAKLSVRLSYLPRAQRAGATIYANTLAERILVSDGRATGIVAQLLDPATREPRGTLTVRAKVVVVAAGAIHTPALLSRNTLGNRSGQLGRNLRIHPATAAGGYFDDPVYAWRGTLQSYAVYDWHESDETLIEVTASVPSVGAGTVRGAGMELKELLASYSHIASAGLFVSDTSSGRVITLGRAREPIVTYRLNALDTVRMVRGLAKVTEIFLAAGARAVMTNIPGVPPVHSMDQIADLKEEAIKPSAMRLTAFHPVGTARMGSDPERCVVDSYGELHGVHGLFVADGSVLPGGPSVNPQVTIMAMATRTVEYLRREGARYFG